MIKALGKNQFLTMYAIGVVGSPVHPKLKNESSVITPAVNVTPAPKKSSVRYLMNFLPLFQRRNKDVMVMPSQFIEHSRPQSVPSVTVLVTARATGKELVDNGKDAGKSTEDPSISLMSHPRIISAARYYTQKSDVTIRDKKRWSGYESGGRKPRYKDRNREQINQEVYF